MSEPIRIEASKTTDQLTYLNHPHKIVDAQFTCNNLRFFTETLNFEMLSPTTVSVVILTLVRFLAGHNVIRLDIFDTVKNAQNVTYSNVTKILSSSSFECCIECSVQETCFAVIINGSGKLCHLFHSNDNSQECFSVNVRSSDLLWVKQNSQQVVTPMVMPQETTTAQGISTETEETKTDVITTEEPRPSCPDGFQFVSEGCFFFTVYGKSWNDAQAECLEYSGLAQTNTPEVNSGPVAPAQSNVGTW